MPLLMAMMSAIVTSENITAFTLMYTMHNFKIICTRLMHLGIQPSSIGFLKKSLSQSFLLFLSSYNLFPSLKNYKKIWVVNQGPVACRKRTKILFLGWVWRTLWWLKVRTALHVLTAVTKVSPRVKSDRVYPPCFEVPLTHPWALQLVRIVTDLWRTWQRNANILGFIMSLLLIFLLSSVLCLPFSTPLHHHCEGMEKGKGGGWVSA